MKNLLTTLLTSIFIAGLWMLFSGCPINNRNNKIKYETGVFPETPQNFKAVNSIYDDYNMALPIIQYQQFLSFSSNRNSKGGNFDIIGDRLNIIWDMETGELSVDNSGLFLNTSYVDSLLLMMNTDANEFGPYALSYSHEDNIGKTSLNLIIYSSGTDSTNYRPKLVYYKTSDYDTANYYGPADINLIASDYSDQYISFFGKDATVNNAWEFDAEKFEQLLFCSNRGGDYDIYKVDLPKGNDFVTKILKDTVLTPKNLSILNSSQNDKCPYVNAKLLVLASNRDGGFGGYDLYYSIYKNGEWSKPKNFGDKINTPYNEYRPVTIAVDGFVNDLLLFSSDRPGGMGGYDLYYCGIDKVAR